MSNNAMLAVLALGAAWFVTQKSSGESPAGDPGILSGGGGGPGPGPAPGSPLGSLLAIFEGDAPAAGGVPSDPGLAVSGDGGGFLGSLEAIFSGALSSVESVADQLPRTLFTSTPGPTVAQTADEDIGVAPDPAVAAPGTDLAAEADAIPPAVEVGPSTAPVITHRPVPVQLFSPIAADLGLAPASDSWQLGGVGDDPLPALEGDTLISVTNVISAPNEWKTGHTFSTTPTVLSAFLAGYDNIHDYEAALAAE